MNNYSFQSRSMDEPEFTLLGEPVSPPAEPRSSSDGQFRREALARAQRMETLGLLAAGVAHDTNNVLSVILGEAGLLKSAMPSGSSAEKSLEQISIAAESAARFLRQLLQFSRRQSVEFLSLDLNTVLGNLELLLSRLMGKCIALEVRCAAGLPPIQADLGMIEQLLFNLAINARDAMSEGGTLRIVTTVVQVDAASVRRHHEARQGTFVCLEVADTGCGMDGETLRQMFEPFFSTKKSGQGTGLGLATVDGIVRQHLGWIEVESTIGAGSTFKVFLPSAAPASACFVETEFQLQLLHGGQETILLVEDDSDLRQIVGALLRGFGYRVLEAGCESEALRLWDERNGNVDLLLLDLVMPGGQTGHTLALQLRSRRPQLKVIYSSGYSADLLADIVGDTGAAFLPKPYRSSELAEIVRRCLNATPRSLPMIIPA